MALKSFKRFEKLYFKTPSGDWGWGLYRSQQNDIAHLDVAIPNGFSKITWRTDELITEAEYRVWSGDSANAAPDVSGVDGAVMANPAFYGTREAYLQNRVETLEFDATLAAQEIARLQAERKEILDICTLKGVYVGNFYKDAVKRIRILLSDDAQAESDESDESEGA